MSHERKKFLKIIWKMPQAFAIPQDLMQANAYQMNVMYIQERDLVCNVVGIPFPKLGRPMANVHA